MAHNTLSEVSDKKHHTAAGFRNNYEVERHGFGDVLKWMWNRRHIRTKLITLPVITKDHDFLRNNRSELSITWLGHSCFLFQYDGLNILTDPMLGERASPVSWMGPRRLNPPAMTIKELPQVDWVVLSHDHYDHLDRGSILELQDKQKDHPPTYFVPQSIKKWFEHQGIHNVVEMDWWDHKQIGEWTVYSVPAQHFSGRKPFIQNDTLWSGWVLKHKTFSYYFVGDTGYSPDFKLIGEKLGPFDLATIPIGAYDPRWFMSPVHVDPEHAVKIHMDIRSHFSIAMHWGTFKLTDEDMDEPVKLLKENLKKFGVPEDEFITANLGEVFRLNDLVRVENKK